MEDIMTTDLKAISDSLGDAIEQLQVNKDSHDSWVYLLGVIKGQLKAHGFTIPVTVEDKGERMEAFVLGVFYAMRRVTVGGT